MGHLWNQKSGWLNIESRALFKQERPTVCGEDERPHVNHITVVRVAALSDSEHLWPALLQQIEV